jgi:hypothetical protein
MNFFYIKLFLVQPALLHRKKPDQHLFNSGYANMINDK